jgi:[ribosomal protein S5]-alanine N-acetyltransferase
MLALRIQIIIVVRSEGPGVESGVMVELINLHAPALASLLDDPEKFQVEYNVSLRAHIAEIRESALHLQQRLSDSRSDPKWCGYLVVNPQTQQVVGFCDFKGPPTKDGIVEISYSTFSEFQGLGFASSTAAKLLAVAFKDPMVKHVIADTLPEHSASTRVLEKNGFKILRPVEDPATGLVWRWCLERTDQEKTNLKNST